MDISDPTPIIKNKEYLATLATFRECIAIEFDKIKRDDNFDGYLSDPKYNKACFKYAEALKNIINNGGLDYDNFKL